MIKNISALTIIIILLAMQALLSQTGGLHIVAVGSVLTKAWELLKEGTNPGGLTW